MLFTRNAATRTAGMPPSAMPMTTLRSTSPIEMWRTLAAAAVNAAPAAMIGNASRGSIPIRLSITRVGA